MCTRNLVAFSLAGLLAATSAFAANTDQLKAPGQGQAVGSSPATASPSQDQLILNNTAELLKQVAALSKQVNALTAAQSQQTAQLKDMAQRLYGTCVMVQYSWYMINSSAGLGDYPLCTWAGFKNLEAVGNTGHYFGANSTNFDTPFGAP
jgi:hypothetical protein